MADLEHVRDQIAEIAGRPKNVTLEEIERVVNQLRKCGYDVPEPKRNDHQVLFRVGSTRFGVCSHNRGSKQVKSCYVKQFIAAMIELGIYDEGTH